MSGYGARKATEGLPLFENVRPISRREDPETSKLAEAKLRSTGRLGDGCRKTLHALREHLARFNEAPTTAELAGGDPGLVHLFGRRLSDLRELGHVSNPTRRKCKATGSMSLTWSLAAIQPPDGGEAHGTSRENSLAAGVSK